MNAQELSFRNISTAQGLPSSEVYSCLQDHSGYIWFGTDAGICRYNGYEFRVFTVNDGLADNTVFHISEDNKGRIWCDGISGSICYIQNEQVHKVRASDSLTSKLENGKKLIRGIHADSNGKIWIATARTMFWLDENDGFSICHEYPGIPSGVSEIVVVTDDSTVLISSSALPLDIKTQQYFRLKRNFYIQREGHKTQVRIPTGYIASYFLMPAVMDAEGNLIFSLGNVIYRISPDGNADSLTSLQQQAICMYAGTDHSIWIGTRTDGVYC